MYRHRPRDLFATLCPSASSAPIRGWRSSLPVPVLVLLLAATLFAGACTGHRKPVTSPTAGAYFQQGRASWYGPGFHGRRTASGERYDMHELTAAHPTLPFGTRVVVTNLDNGRKVEVRITDRGPFAKQRILDLSYAAAGAIGLVAPGSGRVGLALASRQNEIEAPPPSLLYTVQVGAFSEPERAADLLADLQPLYPETTVHSDGLWNRVQVGRFANRDQADSLRRELAVLGVTSVVVAAR